MFHSLVLIHKNLFYQKKEIKTILNFKLDIMQKLLKYLRMGRKRIFLHLKSISNKHPYREDSKILPNSNNSMGFVKMTAYFC